MCVDAHSHSQPLTASHSLWLPAHLPQIRDRAERATDRGSSASGNL